MQGAAAAWRLPHSALGLNTSQGARDVDAQQRGSNHTAFHGHVPPQGTNQRPRHAPVPRRRKGLSPEGGKAGFWSQRPLLGVVTREVDYPQ